MRYWEILNEVGGWGYDYDDSPPSRYVRLPPNVVEAFLNLAHLQRDEPEFAMIEVQKAYGGGILSSVVEHVGDIIHRITVGAPYGRTGKGYARDKSEKSLYWLTGWPNKQMQYFIAKGYSPHTYSFDSEMSDNIASNAKHTKVPFDDYKKRLNDTLSAYAKAHSKLPVYNEIQYVCRAAAMSVGQKQFQLAIKYLRHIFDATNSPDWDARAFDYKLDSNGNLLQYNPS